MDDTALAARLRAGAAHHNDCVRAAVELLIWHEGWLRRSDFLNAALYDEPTNGKAHIRWNVAAQFAEAGPRGSTSELAILELAIALGRDRYRFGNMGHAHRDAIVRAITTAVGR